MDLARRHRLAIELALLALVAYLAALGGSAALRAAVADVPPPPAEVERPAPASGARPLAEYAIITERDVFNPAGTPRAGTTDHPALRLWGVGLDGREARAVIEDLATHRQDLYRIGDEVLELAPPASETPAETSAEPPAAPAAARGDRIRRTGENAFVVDRREIVGAVDNMSGLMTQLRAVAEVHDGHPAGFRLFRIQDGSLFARLGLRDGEVVRRVNGTEIGEPAALLGFLQRLRDEPRVALDIVRGDAPRTLVYDLR